MTNKNKIWYPDEVIKAINDFYEDIQERGKKKPEVKSNNIVVDLSNNKNLLHIRDSVTPQALSLSLF